MTENKKADASRAATQQPLLMPELKPCPFCGIEPITKEWEVGGHTQIKIICDGDFCHVHPSVFGNKKAMVEIWNTRADLVPERARNECDLAVTDESNSVATHDSATAKREALNDLFWMKQLIEDRTETMDFSKTELDGAYETIRATLQTLSDEDLRAITSTKMDTKYDYLNRELEEQARLNGMGAERERSGCDLAVTDESNSVATHDSATAKREALEWVEKQINELNRALEIAVFDITEYQKTRTIFSTLRAALFQTPSDKRDPQGMLAALRRIVGTPGNKDHRDVAQQALADWENGK